MLPAVGMATSGVALGSTSELEYHLIAARDIRAIPESQYLPLSHQVIEVRMMIHALLRSLKAEQKTGESESTTAVKS